MRVQMGIRDRSWRWGTFKGCFVAKQAAQWMVSEGYVQSTVEAVDIGSLPQSMTGNRTMPFQWGAAKDGVLGEAGPEVNEARSPTGQSPELLQRLEHQPTEFPLFVCSELYHRVDIQDRPTKSWFRHSLMRSAFTGARAVQFLVDEHIASGDDPETKALRILNRLLHVGLLRWPCQ